MIESASMRILGIHTLGHDSSVALIENGKILYAASNERFSRIKMDKQAPLQALKDCLEYTKTRPEDIDKIVISGDPLPLFYLETLRETSRSLVYAGGKYLIWLRKPTFILQQILIWTGIPNFVFDVLIPEIKIRFALRGFKGKYEYLHHHLAHLYAAYHTSGWDECLVACIEGSGFDETLSVFHVNKGKWKKIAQSHVPHSAGKYYAFITLILGFNRLTHAGKVTGLAAYGNPSIAYEYVKSFLKVENLELKFDYLRYLKAQAFYYNHGSPPPDLKIYKKEDLAAAFQRRLEECVTDILAKAARQTKVRRIALAGGVIANVKLNQKIHELREFDDVHIYHAMGDDGVALGAALHFSVLESFKSGPLETVYFGPDFSDQEVLKTLKRFKIKYRKLADLEKEVALLLSKNNIVARFSGRMEHGPRALGNRSILCQAIDKEINNSLNKKLLRTEFMPFAPVTLEKHADKCYQKLTGARYPARFMTITFKCTQYMKSISPAVVHIDGTARPQILRQKDNPDYFNILNEYYKLTGIPSLVNTSFNIHNEPMVCAPEDAIRAFLQGCVDYLAIGSYLVGKADNERLIIDQKQKSTKQSSLFIHRN